MHLFVLFRTETLPNDVWQLTYFKITLSFTATFSVIVLNEKTRKMYVVTLVSGLFSSSHENK